MKTLFYKTKIITAFLLVFVSCFYSCKRCREQRVLTYDVFTGYYSGLMGFKGHESLSFIKNNQDTIVFKGQGVKSYYEEVGYARGDCEEAYRLLNHEVRFTNKMEGELLFHYYILTPESEYSETFELIFKSQQLIEPILASDYYFKVPLDTIIVLGSGIRKFVTNNGDSIYLDHTIDNPTERVFRIKLGNNIYEVIP